MKYVIIRDDDANATTPVSWIEPLYRPFLDHGLPVHLAMIPCVQMDIRRLDGQREGFLADHNLNGKTRRSIEENPALLDYVRHNAEYVPVLHGFTHAFVDGTYEFNRDEPTDIAQRLERGLAIFRAAGLGRPAAFVAPQDQFSRTSVREAMKRFRVLSMQYLSRRQLPRRYWPSYLARKVFSSRRHFRLGRAIALTHPGCLLSRDKPIPGMLEKLIQNLRPNEVTVIVSHHWEYFRADGSKNQPFVDVLHAFAHHLANDQDIRVIRMDEAREYIA
jgi:Uncharacterized protein conserved in bacteria (DUF2334)